MSESNSSDESQAAPQSIPQQSIQLDAIDRLLINEYQSGFPLCSNPYEVVGERVGSEVVGEIDGERVGSAVVGEIDGVLVGSEVIGAAVGG